MEKLNLTGGIIIIGSLLWEKHLNFKNGTDFIREKWRTKNLGSLTELISVNLPIKYGRISQTRFDTFTMVFSNSVENENSKGVILKINEPLTTFEQIYMQAIALGIAEGIYNEKNNRRLTTTWGTVGIIFSPNLKENNKATYNYLTEKWTEIYKEYEKTFNPEIYIIEENEKPIISDNGIIDIKWKEEMQEFDFLLATLSVPKPKRKITPKEIAEAMIKSAEKTKVSKYKNGYFDYFIKNRENGIITKQDEEILEELNKSENFKEYSKKASR